MSQIIGREGNTSLLVIRVQPDQGLIPQTSLMSTHSINTRACGRHSGRYPWAGDQSRWRGIWRTREAEILVAIYRLDSLQLGPAWSQTGLTELGWGRCHLTSKRGEHHTTKPQSCDWLFQQELYLSQTTRPELSPLVPTCATRTRKCKPHPTITTGNDSEVGLTIVQVVGLNDLL